MRPISSLSVIAVALVLAAGGCSGKDEPGESAPVTSRASDPSGSPVETSVASPSSTSSEEPVGSLEFRRVLMSEVAGGAVADAQVSAEQEAKFASYDCSQPSEVVGDGLLTCEEETGKQLLGPVLLRDGVESADAQAPQGAVSWVVVVHFDRQRAAELADLSQDLAGTGTPVAIVVDGEIVSAPVFESAITGGVVQISGDFDQSAAEELAQRITAAATSS